MCFWGLICHDLGLNMLKKVAFLVRINWLFLFVTSKLEPGHNISKDSAKIHVHFQRVNSKFS
jgi:hypothetical protein